MTARQDVKSTGGRKAAGRFHHGDLAAATLALACETVEAQGHEALSLRQLARSLGVSEPALYRHYADKGALLEAVGWVGLESFAQALAEGLRGHPDPYEAIASCARAYVRHAQAHPGWFRLFFSRTLTGRMGEADRRADAPHKAPSVVVFEDLRRAMGRISADRTDDLYRAWWALAHGLAVFVVEQVFQRVQTDAERIAAADDAIAVHLEAMRCRWGDPPEAVAKPSQPQTLRDSGP